MAKKLLVRTPQTKDGVTPVIGDDGKVAYKETIVEPGAQKYFESLNSSIAGIFKHEFQLVDVDAKGNIVKPEPSKSKDANK